jgi:hypothetical protein
VFCTRLGGSNVPGVHEDKERRNGAIADGEKPWVREVERMEKVDMAYGASCMYLSFLLQYSRWKVLPSCRRRQISF